MCRPVAGSKMGRMSHIEERRPVYSLNKGLRRHLKAPFCDIALQREAMTQASMRLVAAVALQEHRTTSDESAAKLNVKTMHLGGPLLAIELGPETFVVAAEVTEKERGLALPILSALAPHCVRESARQHSHTVRIMPRRPSELGPQLLAFCKNMSRSIAGSGQVPVWNHVRVMSACD